MKFNMLEILFRSKEEVAVLNIVLFSEGLHMREIARRHDVVYGESDSVGEEEAKRAFENARKFVGEVRTKIG